MEWIPNLVLLPIEKGKAGIPGCEQTGSQRLELEALNHLHVWSSFQLNRSFFVCKQNFCP